MKALTRILRLFILGTDGHRRRACERQAGAAHLGGASHALKRAYGTLAVVLAMSVSVVHAQTPTCAAPGCNSVQSDNVDNTAVGIEALDSVTLSTGFANTAVGAQALLTNQGGYQNTATGTGALRSNTTGTFNTASGVFALYSNTSGTRNTASGLEALWSNTTGGYNTASGLQALWANTTGSNNTASGVTALYLNATGNNNTASGVGALYRNTSGSENTASGMNALYLNSTGIRNTATGYNALYDNTYGSDNTASGFQSLNRNTGGHHNTADGLNAVFANMTGNDNTGIGYLALNSNTAGSFNIAIGSNAGDSITGSNNIDVGSTGSAGESGVIRIGGPSQSAAYIAGISSTQLTGSAVYVTANGQLGVLASSERYKTDIASLDGSTQKLHELRPVSFHLKSDPKGAVQYGLIAEEVAKVYPELVIRDQKGNIQGVRYEELAPMLLNEMQRERKETIAKIDAQAAQISELKQQLAGIQAALATFQTKDQLVAQR